MAFNEDSRVKLPGLLHRIRLGYTYQSKKGQNIQQHNNIFVDVFKKSIRDINGKDYSDEQLDDAIKEIEVLTDNTRDKGQAFFDRMRAYSEMRLVNLEEPEKNDFRVVSELPFKGERNVTFRPDITLLINGIPMAFVEVKKPNDKTIYYYCAVIYEDSPYPYHYRTNDTTIKIGDKVVVPVGNQNTERIAEVVSVEQHSRLTVPYPVEKTKFIIRKHEE